MQTINLNLQLFDKVRLGNKTITMELSNDKRCSNCFKVKPVNQFYKKLKRYQARCIACNNEVCKGYQDKLRYLKHPNCKIR